MTTLTIDSRKLTGAPDSGTVNIRTSRAPIFDTATNMTFSGSVTVPLGSDGTLEVTLPASERAETGPAFLYTIEAKLASGTWLIRNVYLPDTATIDLTDLHNVAPAPGEPTRIVKVPTGGTDGQVLVWGDDGFTWMDVPQGPKGEDGEVTTAALTAALAGKVTGTDMTVRVDTTVGTRVLLDHPGGTLMLTGDTGAINAIPYLVNGWKQWNTFPLTLQRVGNRVWLQGMIDGSTSTAFTFLQPPVGYRPAAATYPGAIINWVTGANQKVTAAPAGLSADGAPKTQYTAPLSWISPDPWPTA